MKAITAQVLVVGGGPGGYEAAAHAGKLGLDVVLVEAGRLGGTCLMRGCIPSKALLHTAAHCYEMRNAALRPRFGLILSAPPTIDIAATMQWKDDILDRLNRGVASLLKTANVRVVQGWAEFSDARNCTVQTADGPVSIRAEHVILATGSVPVELPSLPFDGAILSSTEALSLDHMPDNLAVIGAGYIGLELGIAFAKFGSAVTIIEAADHILPLYDRALTAPVRRWLERNGVTIHCATRATAYDAINKVVEAQTSDGEKLKVVADKVLVAVGRKPLTDGWGLEKMAVDMDGPFVRVDARCHTSMKNVWAIGDLVGEPMLAHKASAQGRMVAEIIAGRRRAFEPLCIPAVCFTEPEILSVGLTADQAKAEGLKSVEGRYPFSANGRALTMDAGDDGGFVWAVADRDDHRILGVHAVGRHVAELSAAFATAIEMGARLEDISAIIHAHPSLSEAFHELARNMSGK